MAGDTVCRRDSVISVNKAPLGRALDLDSRGRPLPVWSGCHLIGEGQAFLMNPDVPDSFDGRYFGPLSKSLIEGQAIPIWIESRPSP